MNKALLFRPEPQEGESLRGFLLRLAGANLLGNTAWLKDVPAEIVYLQKMIGTVLHGRAPGWLKRIYKVGGSPSSLIQGHLLGRRARCCPECLAKLRYWPFEWEHILYVACHLHGCLMLGECPHCFRELTWDRARLMSCACGSDITLWPRSSASEQERQLCARLWACLRKETGRIANIEVSQFDQILQDITATEFATLISVFGTHGEISKNKRKNIRFTGIKIEDSNDLMRVSANMLSSWPRQFHAFLQESSSYQEPGVSQGPPRHLLNFGKALRNRFTPPGLDFVMQAYKSFASENWYRVLDRRSNWMDGVDYNKQRYIPAATVAKHLCISRNRMKALVEKKVLRGYVKQTPLDREFFVIERNSIVDAEELLGDHINLTATALLLGLPKERVCELVIGGLLPEASLGRRGQIRMFSRKEVAAFIKRLTAGRREPSEDEENLITVTQILKNYLATEKEFCSFVLATIEQQLQPIYAFPLKQGFAILAFNRRQLLSWRTAFRATVQPDFFTVNEAAVRLGIKQEVAYHLVRIGLLHSLPGRFGRRASRQISSADIEQFQTTYVPATELASNWETSPRWVVHILAARRIYPVTGPNADSGRQYFFKKKDLMR